MEEWQWQAVRTRTLLMVEKISLSRAEFQAIA